MEKSFYFKRFLVVFFLAFFVTGGLFAQMDIVYVYDPARLNTVTGVNPDEEATVAILTEAGYTVTLFPVVALSSATQDQLDLLNNADLVYIGRAVGSTNFQDPNKTFWNEITAPVMTGNMWGIRNNRMNWFNIDQCEAFDGIGVDDVMAVDVVEIDDPVFKGQDTPLDWWIGPYNTIAIDDAGNGMVMAVETANLRPVFVRWEADTEFYDGSVDLPYGPRTFFGMDGDGAFDADGNTLWQYSKYTEAGMQVFLNEVAWLTGNLEDNTSSKGFGLNPMVSFNQSTNQLVVEMEQLAKVAVLDVAGRQIYSGLALDNSITVDANAFKSGMYLVRISDNSNKVITKKFIKK
ncbi:MAG: T9SS type A sorting domain-containing protein [Prolixibacteraceae bacterium]